MTTLPECIKAFHGYGERTWNDLREESPDDATEYIRSDVVDRLLGEARQRERERCAAVLDELARVRRRDESYHRATRINPQGEALAAASANALEAAAETLRALTDDDTKGGGDG